MRGLCVCVRACVRLCLRGHETCLLSRTVLFQVVFLFHYKFVQKYDNGILCGYNVCLARELDPKKNLNEQ